MSVDGPNPNAPTPTKLSPKKEKEIEKVTDYSKRVETTATNTHEDFFKMVDKDKVINNILEPKRTIKYFPPKRLPNPFEDAMIQQEKFL